MGGSEFPDVCMDGIARHKASFHNYSRFFKDAVTLAVGEPAILMHPSTPSSRFFNRDEEGVSAQWQKSRRRLGRRDSAELRDDPAEWFAEASFC